MSTAGSSTPLAEPRGCADAAHPYGPKQQARERQFARSCLAVWQLLLLATKTRRRSRCYRSDVLKEGRCEG
jgi:hypothetical protein